MSRESPRERCEGCGRPVSVCLCAHIVQASPRTKVVVLQHPRESENAIGTAWMVERCLGAERIVGVELEDDPRYRALLADRDLPAVLLAPGPSAIDLHSHPPDGPVTLVVIDGTWAQARKVLRKNPSLARLPRYAFTPATPSNYRIRKEPAAHCVSTIEATVAALTRLDAERGGDIAAIGRVLETFDAMVDMQLRIAAEHADSRHRRAAIDRATSQVAREERPARPALPRDRLVVIALEANAWPETSEHGAHHEIVHLVAERLAHNDDRPSRFEAFIAPTLPLTSAFTFHSKLPEERVLGGESRASFRTRLGSFLRDDDVLGVWGRYPRDLLASEGFAGHTCIDLRIEAIRRIGQRSGDAAETARTLGADVDAPWTIARTGTRLASITGVARSLSG